MDSALSALADEWRISFEVLRQCHGDSEIENTELRLDELTSKLLLMRSGSLQDVLIKLSTLLALAPIKCGGVDDFPWPELQALAMDLDQLIRSD